MKASELIIELKNLIDEYGDLNCSCTKGDECIGIVFEIKLINGAVYCANDLSEWSFYIS